MTSKTVLDMPIPDALVIDRAQVVDIDRNTLDDALERHTTLFEQYTSEIPYVRELVNRSKRELAKAEAAAYLELREPDSAARTDAEEKYGKLTEKILESLVEADREVDDLNDYLIRARSALDSRERLRDVFLARESSIRAMIQLYISGYFGPSTAGENSPRVRGAKDAADMGRGSPDRRGRNRDTRQADREDPTAKFKRRAKS